ncbi:DNA-directed RNA polymerase subunit beta [Ruicaihuangia caeni]|uniref:DNA-directed RNA polymerase subunit beta n=1 Tax=Ruicaihuangia caeni TaxID=3042517 RepID=UPI00338FC2A9
MSERFHRPTKLPGDRFEAYQGAEDPAETLRVAHDTANALLERVRNGADPAIIDRVVAYTDEHGIDALAELWARTSATTLPGALWRLYLLRAAVRQDPEHASVQFQRGTEVLGTIDAAVAGAQQPTGPAEIAELADRILRGVFTGDFGVALDRAVSFCRLMSAGATSMADDQELVNPQRASALTQRGLRYSSTALELADCARLWRKGSLD